MRKIILMLLIMALPAVINAQSVVRSFTINEYASGLAFDGSHFWYGIYGANSNWIYKVDTTDGSIIAQIPNPGNDVYGLTWDGNYLWVMCAYPQDSIYKIDTLGNIVDAFPALAQYHAGLTWDGSHLWNGRYYPNPGFIFKLDPTNGSPLDTIPPPADQTWDLAWDGMNLWVADYYSDSIYEVDPQDGTVLSSFPTPASTPKGLAWFGNYLALIDQGTDYNNDMLYIIDVTGAGTPEISLSSDSHDYGNVVVGDSSVWDLGITNTGTGDLIVTSISSNTPEFYTNFELPDTIQPENTHWVPVTFAPSSADTFNGILTISTNDPINPEVYVNLSGIGIPGAQEIEVPETSHDYGNVRINASVMWDLTIENLGALDLVIDSITVTDPSFYLVGVSFPLVLGPTSSIQVPVWFSPSAPGSYSATLKIFSNDEDEPEVDVSLSGYGDDTPIEPGEILWSYKVNYEPLNPYVSVIRTVPDINGDSIEDVVVGTENDTLYCFHGNASGDGVVLWRLTGPSIYSDRGMIVFDDINADGHPDLIIGTEGGYVDPYDRSVVAVSSLDGSVLWTFDTRQWGNGGWVYEVAPYEDMTGDGISEVLAGAGGDAERALLLNGATGQLIESHWFLDAAVLGIRSIGDVNGDNVPDIACAVADENASVMQFYMLDGSNMNNVLWSYQTGEANWTVTTIGDIDGDNIPDVIAGGSRNLYQGQVLALSGVNGSLIWNHPESGIIQHVRVIGDVNGSGYDDLVFSGVPSNFVCLEGQTGNPIWTKASGQQVQAINPVPDHDGDGIEEVAGGTGYNINKVVLLRGTDGEFFWTFNTGSSVKSVYYMEDISGDDASEILAGTKYGWIYCLSGGWFGAPEETFIRGDANADMNVNLNDLVFLANYLFSSGAEPSCMDAADINDDGSVNTNDIIYLANFFFSSGSPPPNPYPSCGSDPTEDSLNCSYHPCQGSSEQPTLRKETKKRNLERKY